MNKNYQFASNFVINYLAPNNKFKLFKPEEISKLIKLVHKNKISVREARNFIEERVVDSKKPEPERSLCGLIDKITLYKYE